MHLIFIEINFLEIWSNTMYVNKSFDSIYIQQNVPTIFKKLPLIMIILGFLFVLVFYFSLKSIIPFFKTKLNFIYSFFKINGTLMISTIRFSLNRLCTLGKVFGNQLIKS